MSAKKPISSKLGKQETDQQVSNIINEQDIEKEQNKMSSKRLACSHPRNNNGEPVFKKSKPNLNKSNIKTATDIQNKVDKEIESVTKCSKDSKSNFLQPTSSSSDSDDDDMDDDSNDSDDEASDDALDEKILNKSNVSKQTKDKKLTENSDDDDSSDEDSNENDDDDVESYSGKDDEQDFRSKKISGKRVNEIESGDEEDSDDQSDSEVEEDSDSDENSSNNSEGELLGNDQTAAVNSERKGVSSEKTGSESLKNQHSVIKDDKQTEESDEVDDNDDSDEDSSEDADDSNDISDGEIGENAAETNPEDELEAVKKELANIPLEDLMKIKEKLGLKVFNKIMHGGKFDEKKNKVFKRDNKNRPMELSSKRKVRMLRQTDVPKEKVRRDPRFDDLSGEYQEQHFTKNYSFLNDIKAKEKLLIQKKMKKTKDENKKQEMAKLLNRMTQQEQTDETKRKRMELEKQWKEKERQHIKEGKTPYFLKKSDKKKLELAEKFKELQKSGQIDTYMGKRLKKNAQKEKKKLPGRHQRLT